MLFRSYLSDNKKILERRNLQGRNPKWYQFGRSQSLVKFHNAEKLVWSVLATQPPYVLDTQNLLFTGGGTDHIMVYLINLIILYFTF